MSDNNKNALPARDEIEAKYKWKLEDIYQSDSQWEEDFKKVQGMAGEMASFKGRLAGDMKTLLECFKFSEQMLALNDKL